MERKPTVSVENLVTGYAGKRGESVAVTNGVTASLLSGELTCLLGPNGAGKSTLLKTLSAFIAPLSGRISVGGREVGDYSPDELAKQIGVVLTERVNLDNMTAGEMVGLGRSPYTGFLGRLSADDIRIVDEAIDLVGINDLRNRTVGTLSDGERQKVMIAKALAQETPIVFLDEPTAFLDYPSKIEIMQLLQRLSRVKDKTVFLSTHDLELALQIADKVWLLDKQLGVTVGTPEDLALNGALGRYFERDGVKFDIETGLFRIDNHPTHRVRLIGNDNRRNLVVKALARCGIEALPEADSTNLIEILDDGFRVNGRQVGSIGELVDAVAVAVEPKE